MEDSFGLATEKGGDQVPTILALTSFEVRTGESTSGFWSREMASRVSALQIGARDPRAPHKLGRFNALNAQCGPRRLLVSTRLARLVPTGQQGPFRLRLKHTASDCSFGLRQLMAMNFHA